MSHIWMSHVTSSTTSYMRTSHVHTDEWVMSDLVLPCTCRAVGNASCHTHELVMSHMWTRHITHTNESCYTYTYEWVMSHMNESCHTYEWVMPHIWMSWVPNMNLTARRVAWSAVSNINIWSGVTNMPRCGKESFYICLMHINESCHTYGWVMSYTWTSHYTCTNLIRGMVASIVPPRVCRAVQTSHATHVNESCQTCEWVISRTRVVQLIWAQQHETSRLAPPRICRAMDWVMPHTCTYISHVTYMSHVTYINLTTRNVASSTASYMLRCANKSCHTYAWAMSHAWVMPHVWIKQHEGSCVAPPRICRAAQWVTSHMFWVIPHVCMSHFTCMNRTTRRVANSTAS